MSYRKAREKEEKKEEGSDEEDKGKRREEIGRKGKRDKTRDHFQSSDDVIIARRCVSHSLLLPSFFL